MLVFLSTEMMRIKLALHSTQTDPRASSCTCLGLTEAAVIETTALSDGPEGLPRTHGTVAGS